MPRFLSRALAVGMILGAGTAGAQSPHSRVGSVDVGSTPPAIEPIAITANGASRPGHGCGTPDVTPSELANVRVALTRWRDETTTHPAGGTVRVAVHVITAKGQGDVSDAQVAGLIGALNREYDGTGYRFELAGIDRTENPDWFRMTPGSTQERQAKQALAVDPARRLNLYLCGAGQDSPGWASFPWSAPEGHYLHGVVHNVSLPGHEPPKIPERSVAREVGHYLGFHQATAFDSHELPAEPTSEQVARSRAIVAVFRPSLFLAPVHATASKPEIVPGLGAEPEEGRVLAYRGAFPNPFRAETTIRFTLPTRQAVSLRIYSVTGQLVRTLVDAPLPPGDHSAMFRADDLPSGAYFAQLSVGQVQMSRTVMLIR